MSLNGSPDLNKLCAFEVLSLLVLKLEYYRQTRLILWLLMSWLLALPGHQHPWYSLCMINKWSSCTRGNLNPLWTCTGMTFFRDFSRIPEFLCSHLPPFYSDQKQFVQVTEVALFLQITDSHDCLHVESGRKCEYILMFPEIYSTLHGSKRLKQWA